MLPRDGRPDIHRPVGRASGSGTGRVGWTYHRGQRRGRAAFKKLARGQGPLRVAVSSLAELTIDAVRPASTAGEVASTISRAQRQTANIKVLSYVPEPKDLTFLDGGWAVGWSQWTASVMASTGAAPTQVRGTVLGVLKKLPDGSWKGFRGMGLLSRD